MIEVKRKVTSNNGMSIHSNEVVYSDDPITNKSAQKKQAILDIITEGSQLTLLGLLVQQLGDKVGLDTPEFTQAKQLFAGIQAILNENN